MRSKKFSNSNESKKWCKTLKLNFHGKIRKGSEFDSCTFLVKFEKKIPGIIGLYKIIFIALRIRMFEKISCPKKYEMQSVESKIK